MATSLKGQDARNGVSSSDAFLPPSSVIGLGARRWLVFLLLLLVLWIIVDLPYRAGSGSCGVYLSGPAAELLFHPPCETQLAVAGVNAPGEVAGVGRERPLSASAAALSEAGKEGGGGAADDASLDGGKQRGRGRRRRRRTGWSLAKADVAPSGQEEGCGEGGAGGGTSANSSTLTTAAGGLSPGLDEEASTAGDVQMTAAAAAALTPDPCEGRYVYMYNMPAKFNSDFLAGCKELHPKTDMCPAMSHGGTGEQAQPAPGVNSSLLPPHAWSDTDQFSLDVLVHARMRDYECLTHDAARATAFFVPYYANLDLFFDLYSKDLRVRDRGAAEAVAWLEGQPTWHARRGRDHIIVLGRVMWDFTRTLGDSKTWGCNLMSLSYMRQVTVLTIESSNNRKHGDHVHSIPYPSFFHPSVDADVAAWQAHVRGADRPFLVGFAARGHGMGTGIRAHLERLCAGAAGVCQAKNCGRRRCMRAHAVMWLYLTSRFCLQPPGDTPTRKAIFDCMLGGGIPVFFTPDSAHRQYYWHLPGDWKSYSVLINRRKFDWSKGKILMKTLRSIPNNVTQQMRETIIGLIPRIAYALPGAQLRQYRDAFDIAIEGAVTSIRNRTS